MQNHEEATPAPDLATQLEAILAGVWAAEAEWRLDDRISLSVDLDARRRPHP